MTIEEAIKNRERCLEYIERCAKGADPESVEAVRLSLAALREKAEREKNEPLTLDELRQMDGEPVFVKALGISDEGWCVVFVSSHGDIAAQVPGVDEPYFGSDYGKGWLAYRSKPKEAK